jgi:hypothetical protein
MINPTAILLGILAIPSIIIVSGNAGRVQPSLHMPHEIYTICKGNGKPHQWWVRCHFSCVMQISVTVVALLANFTPLKEPLSVFGLLGTPDSFTNLKDVATDVIPGRAVANVDGEFVVFVVGMRINKWWKPQQVSMQGSKILTCRPVSNHPICLLLLITSSMSIVYCRPLPFHVPAVDSRHVL